MSSSAPSMSSPATSLTIRPSGTASLGGLPLRSPPVSPASPAPVLAAQPISAPVPAPATRTSFVLSSSRSCHLRLLSPEAIARHASGSSTLPIRGPPRLAEGFIPFPAPAPSPADDPRVVFANTTPETHRSQTMRGSGSTHVYEFEYTRGNGAGPGPSTAAARTGADQLSTTQEASTNRSFPPPSAAVPPPHLLSREFTRTSTSDGGTSASALAMSAVTDFSRTSISLGTSASVRSTTTSESSRSSQRPPWVPSRTPGRSVDATLNFTNFKAWSVRSEDFGQSRKELRSARGNGADTSSSTTGSGSTGPLPEPIREREEEDNFGRELDELENVVSDMSEKLATLHFVGREASEVGSAEGSMNKGKERARGEARRERREARRAAEQAAATPSRSANRPSSSRKSSSSASSCVSGIGVSAVPVPPLILSAS